MEDAYSLLCHEPDIKVETLDLLLNSLLVLVEAEGEVKSLHRDGR